MIVSILKSIKAEYSINASEIKLVDSIVQIFCIFADFLSTCFMND